MEATRILFTLFKHNWLWLVCHPSISPQGRIKGVTILFRTRDHVLDLTSLIKKSKIVENKHGGQKDGKRGKEE
jgi:hypothetical protein